MTQVFSGPEAQQLHNGIQITAAPRALANPIILSRIIRVILRDDYKYWHDDSCPVSRSPAYTHASDEFSGICDEPKCTKYGARGVVLRCSLVNKFWFREAIPLLWRKPFISLYEMHKKSCLSHIFGVISLDFRQFYADSVKCAVLDALQEPFQTETTTLCDLQFPRLKHLRVPIFGVRLPHGDFHCVKSVTMILPHRLSREFQDFRYTHITMLLEQFPTNFPELREIKLVGCDTVLPGVQEHVRMVFPHFKCLVWGHWVEGTKKVERSERRR